MQNPDARPPHSTPALFGGYGLLFLLGVTLIAARMSAPWVALLAGSLLLVGALARLWARYSLARLTYTRRLSAPRAFCGDTLVLETRLGNRKLLPLPWVEVWERLPLALDPGEALEPSPESPGYGWVSQGAALWPYQRARWEHALACRHRGVFTLGVARARAGDPFGLCEREAWLPAHLEVVVYPRVVTLRHLALPLRHPLLDAASRRSLISDPLRTAYVHEYQPGDPPRLIHWRASAHQGALQVRVPEPATSLQVCLLLDAHSFELVLPLYRETLFELSISALASIAVYLHQAGQPVGLFTDAAPGADLLPSANPAQLQSLLEALARVQPLRLPRPPGWPLARLPRGSAVVLAASDVAHNLGQTIALLEQAGHQVLLLYAGQSGRVPQVPPDRLLRLDPGRDLAATLEGVA